MDWRTDRTKLFFSKYSVSQSQKDALSLSFICWVTPLRRALLSVQRWRVQRDGFESRRWATGTLRSPKPVRTLQTWLFKKMVEDDWQTRTTRSVNSFYCWCKEPLIIVTIITCFNESIKHQNMWNKMSVTTPQSDVTRPLSSCFMTIKLRQTVQIVAVCRFLCLRVDSCRLKIKTSLHENTFKSTRRVDKSL